MSFGGTIDRYFDHILDDLGRLVAIPSVCADPLPGKPFGAEPARALDYLLSRAGQLGLETHNVGYYAGDACYGAGPDFVDVLTHLDVVPAGSCWNTNPFELRRNGNLLFGRGTADDKAAAVVSLYCLKALMDAGVNGNFRLRAVFGCGEEISSNDLDMYYQKEGFPTMGFTPDCSYGVCNCEKGIYRLCFQAPVAPDCPVCAFEAGIAVNAVPSKASATIRCSEEQYKKLLLLTGAGTGFTVKIEHRGHHIMCCVESSGKAAHGAEPELGENAASKLICLLHNLFPAGESGAVLTFLAEKIGMQYDGKTLGIAMNDKPSGALTLNLGLVHQNSGSCTASVDIRYPATMEKGPILQLIQESAAGRHIAIIEVNHSAPLYVPAEHPLIQLLSESYRSITSQPCDIYSTGGGTYARHAGGNVVAFGPIFKEEPPRLAHGPNEHIDLDYLRRHARICLEAMYRLFTCHI